MFQAYKHNSTDLATDADKTKTSVRNILLKKGGNPSTRSRTDALLRLNPNHLPHLRPPRRTSGVGDSHGLTGGVYKTRERIHRNMLICDY